MEKENARSFNPDIDSHDGKQCHFNYYVTQNLDHAATFCMNFCAIMIHWIMF